MSSLVTASFDAEDETREFDDDGHAAVATLGFTLVRRGVCEPGWWGRW